MNKRMDAIDIFLGVLLIASAVGTVAKQYFDSKKADADRQLAKQTLDLTNAINGAVKEIAVSTNQLKDLNSQITVTLHDVSALQQVQKEFVQREEQERLRQSNVALVAVVKDITTEMVNLSLNNHPVIKDERSKIVSVIVGVYLAMEREETRNEVLRNHKWIFPYWKKIRDSLATPYLYFASPYYNTPQNDSIHLRDAFRIVNPFVHRIGFYLMENSNSFLFEGNSPNLTEWNLNKPKGS